MKRFVAFVLMLSLVLSLSIFPVFSESNQTGENITPSLNNNAIHLPLDKYIIGENVEMIHDAYGKKDVLKTQENSSVIWDFEVDKTGTYVIKIEYRPLDGTKNSIQRSILIDGNLPNDGFTSIEFTRVYKDGKTPESFSEEDVFRPVQEEVLRWESTYLKPANTNNGEPFSFKFEKGKHSFALKSVQEAMLISAITIEPENSVDNDYEMVLAQRKKDGAEMISNQLDDGIKIHQAEDMFEKSDPTLFAMADLSSPLNQPYHHYIQKLNTVGGSRWKNIGQWISWEIDVPESGFYEIGFRFRQNSGRQSIRRMTIDGKLPFKQAASIIFNNSDDWQVKTVGNGDPYLFYLEKGKREIKLEVVLGEISESLETAEKVLEKLSGASWSLMTVLGSSPDVNRDYHLEKNLPEVFDVFRESYDELKSISESWLKISGERDARIAQVDQLADQVKYMLENVDKVAGRYSFFRDSISAYANLIVTAKEQPLLLDYLFIKESEAELPKANAGFFASIKDAIMRFLSTFFNDYNNLSKTGETERKIKVWIGSGLTGGRDQAQVLSQMIKQDFTPKHGIGVEIQLVPAGTVLTATLANKGPDVALQTNGNEPVNFAMRNAVVNLTKMPDFDKIAKDFPQELFVSYNYQGGVYALPETMTFPMLFYRKDVLEKLGIDVEKLKTWDDITKILPDIQANNMNFAIPALHTSYYLFLMQNGGSIYKDNGAASNLDSKNSLDAFNTYTRYYTSFGLPFNYSFETRFRTGEIPIGLADFSTYNLLKLSAPEIDGLWEMTTVPGTVTENGVNYSVPVTGAGAVIMSSSKFQTESWEFLKWWVSEDSQYNYGIELESVMGTGARYNTANPKAFSRLPWNPRDRQQIMAQLDSLKGIPEVPGSYITPRNVDFAIKTINTEKGDARATLLSYIREINDEISSKRQEFGLE